MPENQTRWWKYVQHITHGERATDIAHRAGFDQSALTRWKNGSNADPKFAVQLARAYNQNVLNALVECGLITEEEADLHEVTTGVADLSTKDIIEELARRIDS